MPRICKLNRDTKKIKRLPLNIVKDIESKNYARKLANLNPIKIKIRKCIMCNGLFESFGNRSCGCSTKTVGTISGREII